MNTKYRLTRKMLKKGHVEVIERMGSTLSFWESNGILYIHQYSHVHKQSLFKGSFVVWAEAKEIFEILANKLRAITYYEPRKNI